MKKLLLEEKDASSRTNRWVDPSFTDLPGDISSLVEKGRKGIKVSCSKPESKRKRKGEYCNLNSLSSFSLKESALRDHEEPWVDRYSPCSKCELAVHKKKIEEVESWMRVYTKTSKGGILLLTGPSGCGKTATVRVLSQELGLRIQEWINPSSLESVSSIEHDRRMNGLFITSQLTQFQEFLLRANKYNCLKMVGDGGVTDMKLILIEEFPNQFFRQPTSLHDILRWFVKTSRCPLVFIVSDSLNRDCSSRFLFPRQILEELGIICISFNPVAPTTIMKILTQISAQESRKSSGRMYMPDQAVLETLSLGSSGDIRSAINSLQFSALPDTSLQKGLWRKDQPMTSLSKAISRAGPRKKSTKQTMDQEEEQAIGGKDTCLFLFRALGRILHSKRGNPECVDQDNGTCGPGLPSHLSQHERGPLQVDPEDVVERSHMSGEFFNLYLHQNYPDFFSQVEDLDRASEYLSDADLLTADWTSRAIMGDYGSSVATRGLLHSNSQQVAVGFRPLHKPAWWLIDKKHRENCLAAQCLFRSFCLTPVSLQTELLPYMAKLTNPMRNQAQIAFIQDVGHMSLKRFPCRLKLEALTNKDPGQLELDSEEEEGMKTEECLEESEDVLQASQPRPTTSQVLLEDEDIMIEEYNSD